MVLLLVSFERNSRLNNSFEPSMYEISGYILNPGLNLIQALNVRWLKLVSTAPRSMKLFCVAFGKFTS